MSDILQYRKVISLEYSLKKGEIKINMEGTSDNYYSKIDEVKINPENANLSHLEIFKKVVKMRFSRPIVCNIESGRYFSSMRCGVKIDGKNKDLLVEKLENLASKLGVDENESEFEEKSKNIVG